MSRKPRLHPPSAHGDRRRGSATLDRCGVSIELRSATAGFLSNLISGALCRASQPYPKHMWHFCRLLLAAAILPTLAAQDFSGAAAVDDAINQALAQKRMHVAVLIVGHAGDARSTERPTLQPLRSSRRRGHDARHHLRRRLAH